MSKLIIKVLATFIISQMMPLTMTYTLPQESTTDAYMAGMCFNTLMAGVVFVIYAIIFFDSWNPKHWYKIGGVQLKRVIAYSLLIVLLYQLIPSALALTVYVTSSIHTTCKGAYEFGWLIDAFISFTGGYFYFSSRLQTRASYYAL